MDPHNSNQKPFIPHRPVEDFVGGGDGRGREEPGEDERHDFDGFHWKTGKGRELKTPNLPSLIRLFLKTRKEGPDSIEFLQLKHPSSNVGPKFN